MFYSYMMTKVPVPEKEVKTLSLGPTIKQATAEPEKGEP
jgi:hypothetical protein